MDYYGYTDYDAVDSIVTGIIGIYAVILIIALVVLVVQTIGYWQIYKKAGKGGWEAIIPYYNNWVLVEISGLNWWWFLLFFAPLILSWFDLDGLGYLVSTFASFNCFYNLAKRFHKGVGFAVCLTLFTPVCVPILGFSKNLVYDGTVPVSKNGVFGGEQSTNNGTYNNSQNNYQQSQMYNNAMNNGVPPVAPIQQGSMNVGQPAYNSASTEMEFRFCGNCGTKMAKDVRFCPNCGKENL